ncbi:MAG: BON domain-containing protein [Bdellovibrionales bacterium]|nr:BON domain-containing protein [Bdellovibrionales bacterium]
MRFGFHSWDEQMYDDLSHLLRVHIEVDTTNIQFDLEEGEVCLVGSVPDDEMRFIAEDLVARSPGVKGVRNYLEVKYNETIFP